MFYDIFEVASRIKKIRKNRNITQSKFAEVLNLSENQIYKIESGKSGCSLDSIIIISEALNISIDYLLLGKNIELNISPEIETLLSAIKGHTDREIEYINKIVISALENIDLLKSS